MLSRLRLVTPPAAEPVSLAQAKAHLRLDNDDDDELVETLIGVARDWVENFLNRALVTQGLLYTLSPSSLPVGMPLLASPVILVLPLAYPQVMARPIELPRPPVQAITAVTRQTIDGAVTVLDPASDYYVDTANEPGRVTLRRLGQTVGSDLSIAYVAGYGDAADVPVAAVHAVKLLVAWLYEDRGDAGGDMPAAVRALLWPIRMKTFA